MAAEGGILACLPGPDHDPAQQEPKIMKPQYAKIKIAASVLFVLTALSCNTVRIVNRSLEIVSHPPGADVYINNDNDSAGKTPFNTNRITTGIRLKVEVRMKDYAPEQQDYSLEDVALHTQDNKGAWVLPAFNLVRLHLEVPIQVSSSVEGATVLINNQLAGPAPWKGKLVFDRTKSTPWEAPAVSVVKSNYDAWITNITESQAEAAERMGLELDVKDVKLDEIRRYFRVVIQADISNAMVSINDIPAGTTPLTTNLAFTRANGTQPWSTATVKISKEGYEYRPPGQNPTPDFVKAVTVESAAAGLVSAQGFATARFVSALLRAFEIHDNKLTVRSTNVMAAVDPGEPGQAPTPFTTAKPEDALVMSRIGAWPERADTIVYSKPSWDSHSKTGDPIGAQICINDSGMETLLNMGQHFDLDPFVTADGKYIYYSSDRWVKRNIWRMDANGTLPQPITSSANFLDTEPVVSADSSHPQLAYTSRALDASPSAPSTIWIAKADGSQATQTQEGQNPAWSPDGKKIAFVKPDNKIWLMDNNGKNPRQLTDGDWHDAYPVWTPSGNQIVFASDRGVNDLKERNWGIWMMAADGRTPPRQLTKNGSFDSCAAVSSDGRHFYFFSNRGAHQKGEESLQIFRLNLPRD